MRREKNKKSAPGHFSEQNRRRRKQRLLSGTLLLAISVGLLMISRQVAGSGEWYAQNLYPYFRRIVGGLSGLFPFSVAEVGLYGGLAALIWRLVQSLRCRIKTGERGAVSAWLAGVWLLGALLLFFYTLGCGINYQRRSFVSLAEMPQQSYTKAELAKTCRWLTDAVNQTAARVQRDEEGLLQISGDYRELAAATMTAAGKRYEALAGKYPAAKGLLVPELLSYQQLSGIYAPFTAEANVNSAMPAYDLPFTACHELAHFQGFMSEDEANFIAFLACHDGPYREFAYSGDLTAWQYAMSRLRRADPTAYEQERARLVPQAEADITADAEFWQQYEGIISDWNQQVNDSYLKAQGQSAGIATYGGLTDLVVNHYLRTREQK